MRKERRAAHTESPISLSIIGRQNACFVLILRTCVEKKSPTGFKCPTKKGQHAAANTTTENTKYTTIPDRWKCNHKKQLTRDQLQRQQTPFEQLEATQTWDEVRYDLRSMAVRFSDQTRKLTGKVSVERENFCLTDGRVGWTVRVLYLDAIRYSKVSKSPWKVRPKSIKTCRLSRQHNNTQNELKTHLETAENICQLLKQILWRNANDFCCCCWCCRRRLNFSINLTAPSFA